MNKKKILVIGLAVALIAMVSFGTLAYFTANDQTVNTFTVGDVNIRQDEHQHDDNGQLVPFEQDQTLLPVADPQNPAADENYVEKIVTVTSTGKNPAYVRTHIAVPTALLDILVLDLSDSTNWQAVSYAAQPTQTVNGVEYTIFSYTYTQALDKDATTDVLLEGVYLKAETDVQENASGVRQFCLADGNGGWTFYDFDLNEKVQVLVATQGVQAQGFADADSALNAAFSDVPDFAA